MDIAKNINGKLLRCGYTTGSCAAAAAKAAAYMLLKQEKADAVFITTPSGIKLSLDISEQAFDSIRASCAVRKDAGDDPDITNGLLVFAEVKKCASGIRIDGGAGVGRVTKPGLDQPVGAAAINSVPRRMIERAVKEAADLVGYDGGLDIIISVPGGEKVALKTFNPRMGIEGGISILGTSGIVEPMSSRALIDTIAVEISQLAAKGEKSILITPGNYGEDFTRDKLGLSLEGCVSCSNFIGDALDAAVEKGFERILLIGHIGKRVKLGIGRMNTHASEGDGRMETLAACALAAGAEAPLLKRIMACVTTDAALDILREAGIMEETLLKLSLRIEGTLARRVPESVETGFLVFTNREDLGGVLIKSKNAERLMDIWRK